jgi:HlyD family secretion protein
VFKIFAAIGVVLAVLAGTVGVIVVKTDLVSKLKGGGMQTGEEVQLVETAYGDLIRTVSAPGSIEPKTMVKISSQVSAEVLALPFREGDSVKKGDVVVRLDPQDLEARLDAVKAGLKAEQARLLGAEAGEIQARLEYNRQTSLFESGDVAKAVLESAEAGYKSAQSNVLAIQASIERAQANITQAEKDLENTTIIAPIDGIIQQLNTEVGETVIVGTTNNAGSVIMEVADLTQMLLKAQIDEANFAPVAEGQEAVIIIHAFSNREFKGVVQKIGGKRQVAADGTGYFKVEILIESEASDRLFSGLTASTNIAVESFYDVLTVPSQAVLDRRVDELPTGVLESEFLDKDITFAQVVYTLKDGKSVATPVTVGPSDLTRTVILGGLSEGDEVVAGPFRVLIGMKHDQALRDRDEVEAEKANPSANPSEDAAGDDAETGETKTGETKTGETATGDGAGDGTAPGDAASGEAEDGGEG